MSQADENNTEQNQGLEPDDLALADEALGEDDEQDPDALWNEIEQSESAAASDDSDTPPAGREDGEVDDDAAATDADDFGAADEGGAPSDKPDGEAPSGESGQAEADPFANATPEQKAAYEAAQERIQKLEQSERSNRGRLSALQRKIDQGQQGAPAQAGAAPSTEGAGGVEGDTEGFLASEEWKSFSEEYPEVASPLASVIGRLESQLAHQNKELAAIGDDRRQSALEEQAERLAEDYPKWQEEVADPGFVDWVHTQPRHIQEAAYRNAEQIVDAQEAADVIGRFKAYRSEQQPDNARPESGGTTKTQGSDKRRQRQLESASTTRSRGPGAASGIPEDGDEQQIWNQFDAMERRQGAGS